MFLLGSYVNDGEEKEMIKCYEKLDDLTFSFYGIYDGDGESGPCVPEIEIVYKPEEAVHFSDINKACNFAKNWLYDCFDGSIPVEPFDGYEPSKDYIIEYNEITKVCKPVAIIQDDGFFTML